jgi:GNAT superfamily N-acetyltransferase
MTKSRSEKLKGVTIRNEFRPGDAGRLIALHGLLYAEEYGFDQTFEAYVAKPLAEFMLTRTRRERIWLVDLDEVLTGCLAIVRHGDTDAQLRWYLLHPDLRGKGLGTKLVEDAVAFCREQGYKRIFLWTVSALTAAARVYVKTGFQLTEEHTHEMWGCMVTEQRYDLIL